MALFRSHNGISQALHRRRKRQGGVVLRRFSTVAVGIAVPLILCAILSFFFFSKTFALDYIDVSMQGSVDPSRIRSLLFQQMDARRNGVFSQKNIFVFDEKFAERSIRDAFVVDTFSLKKIFPNKLRVTLAAKPFRALWYTAGALYDVTTRGTIAGVVDPSRPSFFPKGILASSVMPQSVASSTPVVAVTPLRASTHSKESENEQVPIIVDEKNEPIQQDAPVLTDEELTYLLNLSRAVREQGVHYDYFLTSKKGVTVQVVTNEGWRILTSNRENPFSQMEMVSKVVREKVAGDRKKLKYIDVRFGNRVYYAFK
ncbi:MAG: hypothetical protein Q7S47_00225 [bacterium]|nr:hypothetical protein [bacterium]